MSLQSAGKRRFHQGISPTGGMADPEKFLSVWWVITPNLVALSQEVSAWINVQTGILLYQQKLDTDVSFGIADARVKINMKQGHN